MLMVQRIAAGLKVARKLLEPMLKDAVDFVRQGACIALALTLLQQPEAEVGWLRKHLDTTIGDKHEEAVCKMGAIMACGILDAGTPVATWLRAACYALACVAEALCSACGAVCDRSAQLI